jgi:hypothetical protein
MLFVQNLGGETGRKTANLLVKLMLLSFPEFVSVGAVILLGVPAWPNKCSVFYLQTSKT